jgi:hypothetical protein
LSLQAAEVARAAPSAHPSPIATPTAAVAYACDELHVSRSSIGLRTLNGLQLLAAFTFALRWALTSRVATAPILDEWLIFIRAVFG